MPLLPHKRPVRAELENQPQTERTLRMSDRQLGDDWWLASDGKWYPPQSHPDAPAPPPPPGAMGAPVPESFVTAPPWDWKRIIDFTSRTRRSEFWAAFGIAVGISILGGVIDDLVFGSGLGVFYWASIVAWIWLTWGSSVNRFHDMGLSGWMSLLYFIPLVNFGIFIWVGSGPGNAAPNKWGPPIG
jgi:uncharacterized membrane protein YhaH (DUF805 family)